MAFYDGFEVEYSVEYETEFSSDNYVNLSSAIFVPESFEAVYGIDYDVEFSGANFVATQSAVFSPSSIESVYGTDYNSEFSGDNYTVNTEPNKCFYPGLEVGYIAEIYSQNDTTLEAILNSEAGVFTLRGNSNMTEIIYPVVPISEANKVLFKLDSEEWRVTQKAAASRNEDTDTIRFRVNTNYVATFLGDLHSNKLNQFRLSTPGYTPFGSNSEDNYVRVLSHSRPQREERGLTQTVDVEFLFVAVYP